MLKLLVKIRYLIEYAVFRFIAAAFGAMPLEFASGFSGWMWRHIAPLLSRHARAVDNLSRAFPEKPPAELEIIARDMWEYLGRNFAEAFHLPAIASGARLVVEQPELLDEIAAMPGGKLFCSGHLANWELLAVGLVRHHFKPMSVYQRIKNPYVDAYVLKLRSFLYTGGLHPKDNSLARQLIKSARNGAHLAFLADMRTNIGPSVEFFGMPAPSTPLPGLLVQLLDLPLFICILVREKGVNFRFSVVPVVMELTGNREEDILEVTARIHFELEQVIRRNPAQWMWGHRRWGDFK